MKSQKNDVGSWPLSVRVRDFFDSRIRTRGEAYFQSNLVTLKNFSDSQAELLVRGSDVYEVEVSFGSAQARNEILIQCSCPHYAEGVFCKHCWAAILMIDHEKVASRIPGTNHPRLRHEQQAPNSTDIDKNSIEIKPRKKEPKPLPKIWLKQLRAAQNASAERSASFERFETQPKNPRVAFYVLDLEETRQRGEITIEFYQQETLQSGSPGAIKHQRVAYEDIPFYTHSEDRELLSLLLSSRTGYSSYSSFGHPKAYIPAALQFEILKKIAQTGRFFNVINAKEVPIRFDEGEAFSFLLAVKKERGGFAFEGFLVRSGERIPILEPKLCLRTGVVIFQDKIAKLKAEPHFGWIFQLRERGFGEIPESDGDLLIETLCAPHSPPVEWPPELKLTKEKIDGKPKVVFSPPSGHSSTRGLLADLKFSYLEKTLRMRDSRTTLLDKDNRRMIVRNLDFEDEALGKLKSLEGMTDAPHEHRRDFLLRTYPNHFQQIVSTVLSWGWEVEAYGKNVRQASNFDIKVSSGVDWFDLEARVDYEGSLSLGLPALIAALKKGENLIQLGDGTFGMLPTAWLKKYAPLAQLGEEGEKAYRFTKSQGALLGAWLSSDQNTQADADFSAFLKEIKILQTLKAKSPSRTFRGALRTYQKEGLAWLDFLSRVGFGGILADDMGLGKTIQVLAHLESHYTSKTQKPGRPSLVVVPKSLLFNWQEEAAKFTPKLKVLAYAGQSRHDLLKEIPQHDLVIVTYPILRLDFERLKDFDFHYIVADEAQAIKNAESISHQACRLMKGAHRLAMTGTPVENSVDDLFALLDFVSPGLLRKNARDRMSKAASHEELDTGTLEQLSQALKPFILRRTKEQVLKDLPEKTEKVLHCELTASEQKGYEQLRDYYRSHLRGEIERVGIARSKIVILEALLRLRQASCHPGLIDRKKMNVESTKLDTLLAQLKEVISEGHKALVFSQFTSFLDIVENTLRKEKINYTRLDGKTGASDRRERVNQFQNDPKLKVFLISLKAGGTGLNLTAADYVFILDPWWNPAAESQAIDRTHRIGQKNKVIAYRLIAKNTVEEKILELQHSKRNLANAIITADASLLRKMTAEDIEVLLS